MLTRRRLADTADVATRRNRFYSAPVYYHYVIPIFSLICTRVLQIFNFLYI